MTQNNILNAADYADALLTAKRAKNVLFPLLLLMILIQLAIFFVARFTTILRPPVDPKARNWTELVAYLIGLTDFFGLIFALLFAAVLCLILKVLLVGRLVGVARLTSAVIWAMLLILLVFPWQSFLNNPTLTTDVVQNSLGLKLPGVLYTWAEFNHPTFGANFTAPGNLPFLILRWARFVAWPVIAILILLTAQAKSARGLRQALGNDIVLPASIPPYQP
jgi:hypothetical protein